MSSLPYVVPATAADLEQLCSEQQSEGLHLEFMGCRDRRAWDDIKKSLAVEASAFANTEGGVIVIGIAEGDGQSRNTADHLTPISTDLIDGTQIENVLIGGISPPLEDCDIRPITVQGGQIWIIHVRRSPIAPHQASTDRYHARRQYRTDPLHHFEIEMIRDSRRRKTEGIFGGYIIQDAQLRAIVENQTDWPIFSVCLSAPSDLIAFAQENVQLITTGISTIPARSSFRFHLASVIELFDQKVALLPFDYNFSFLTSPTGSKQVIQGRISIGELRRSMIGDDDPVSMHRAVIKAFSRIEVALDGIQAEVKKLVPDFRKRSPS